MKYIAQLDIDNICIAVTLLNSEKQIEINELDVSLIGKKYNEETQIFEEQVGTEGEENV